MDISNNLSLSEQVHRALVNAARLKVEAMRAKKIAERAFDRILLDQEGKNIAEREAKARIHATFLSLDDAALEAESKAIIARAHTEGLQCRFEAWRSENATNRAEMALGSGRT